MHYLWDNLDKITSLLQDNKTKILMLDFDGTLAPIVKSYQQAVLPSQTRQLLQNLSCKKGFYLAIISGREIKALKKKIALKNIIYGGIHGLEGEIYGKKHIFPIPKPYLPILTEIRNRLTQLTSQFEGALIQDKKITLSLHWWAVKQNQIPFLKSGFDQILNQYKNTKLIAVINGKKVWEIRPNTDCDKGYFAKIVTNEISKLTNSHPLVFYIGDDQTDEDAFKRLQDGITIRVRKNNRSKAKYYLKNTLDVFKFLTWISSII